MKKFYFLPLFLFGVFIHFSASQNPKGFNEKRIQDWLNHLHQNRPFSSIKGVSNHLFELPTHPDNSQTLLKKQKLDSIVFRNINYPELASKDYFEYNNQGLLTKQQLLEWDTTIHNWSNFIQLELFYDASGNVISRYFYSGDQQQWRPVLKSEFLYNANNKPIRSLTADWDPINSKWNPFGKDTLIYNQKGILQRVENLTWNSTIKKYELSYKAEEEYNAMDQQIAETGYEWDAGSSQWIYSFKTEWTYHPNGKVFEIISSLWDETVSDWNYDSKSDEVYNGQQQVISLTEYTFDDVLNKWKNERKSEYSYDANKNLNLESFSIWDDTNLVWEILVKINQSFNNSYALKDLLLPYSDEANLKNFNHMLLQAAYFVNNQGNFVKEETNTYYYSEHILEVKTFESNHVTIYCYPNPTSGMIQVESLRDINNLSYTLYTLEGLLIQKNYPITEHGIDLTNQKNGLYLLEISKDQTILMHQKVVLQK